MSIIELQKCLLQVRTHIHFQNLGMDVKYDLRHLSPSQLTCTTRCHQAVAAGSRNCFYQLTLEFPR
jgi:hypothetical protein